MLMTATWSQHTKPVFDMMKWKTKGRYIVPLFPFGISSYREIFDIVTSQLFQIINLRHRDQPTLLSTIACEDKFFGFFVGEGSRSGWRLWSNGGGSERVLFALDVPLFKLADCPPCLYVAFHIYYKTMSLKKIGPVDFWYVRIHTLTYKIYRFLKCFNWYWRIPTISRSKLTSDWMQWLDAIEAYTTPSIATPLRENKREISHLISW